MAEGKVKEYQRVVNGKTITVKSYDRLNEESAAEVLALPGRPPMSATPGKFPGGRSLPNSWPKVSKKSPKSSDKGKKKTPASTTPPTKAPKDVKLSEKSSKVVLLAASYLDEL